MSGVMYGGVVCALCYEPVEDVEAHKETCSHHEEALRDYQQHVRDFAKAFGQKAPDQFTPMDSDTRALRSRLLLEEVLETLKAAGTHEVIVDDGDPPGALRVQEVNPINNPVDLPGLIDGLVDVLYIAFGTAVAMGIDLMPFFHEVHVANMSKLGLDGKPILRADGKIIKPEGWEGPDIEGVLRDVQRFYKEEVKQSATAALEYARSLANWVEDQEMEEDPDRRCWVAKAQES